ncbi:MAG: HNH endonuclease [Selenomonadaceae bacterium]|nr:HNH endonuclease [Selenomonadaceae bacterium]
MKLCLKQQTDLQDVGTEFDESASMTIQFRRPRKSLPVHRLVALAFILNPLNKPEVNHIDGNPQNNHVSNLEWATRSENEQHAFDTGLQVVPTSEKHHLSKLTDEQARYIRDNSDGLTGRVLARMFDVSPQTISAIQIGKAYKDAGGTIREAQKRSVIPNSVRNEIRRLSVKGSREFGSYGLAGKYGVVSSTIIKIIHEK